MCMCVFANKSAPFRNNQIRYQERKKRKEKNKNKIIKIRLGKTNHLWRTSLLTKYYSNQ